MTALPFPAMGFNQLVATRHGPMLINRNDIYVGRSVAVLGEYCKQESDVLLQIAKPGDTVVEVGANIGSHTVALAQRVMPGGMVWAFEPQRIVFQTLCANIALNSLTNVIAMPFAAGASPGQANIAVFDPDQSQNFGGISVGSGGDSVPLVTLDQFGLAACALLKIDVEGMEADVLRGATATILRHRPVLYVENDRRDRSPGLITMIQALGYRLYWHLPALWSPDSFHPGAPDLFPGIVSINMLCVHRDLAATLQGFLEVEGPDHWPLPT